MTQSPYVSPKWLYEHLNDPQVAIADCRFSLANPDLGQQQYLLQHIPKAFYLDLNQDLSSPVGKHGGRHPLPNPAQLADKLSASDVDSQTLVVAYDDSRFAFAARLWWLLRYLGHDRVAVLNGGFAAWLQAGYPTTDAVETSHKETLFVPQPQQSWIVDIEAVKTRKDLPGVALVDSRESDRYRGEREPIDPVAGHIPGAVNYPWQEVSNAQGYLLAETEQRRRWEELQPAEEILVYCGSGVTACVNLLSLEMAGIYTGKLYAGSWSDWCSYT
ncbi:MAG: sulfurtransferase [Chroococcidiopsidaceae cyanobacterium CP_BM_ER_R8_30]|nr:sulfurtransferase [Chroococcidiopsidaceae cyanobacterium CP_BM_ER_R8_30]